LAALPWRPLFSAYWLKRMKILKKMLAKGKGFY